MNISIDQLQSVWEITRKVLLPDRGEVEPMYRYTFQQMAAPGGAAVRINQTNDDLAWVELERTILRSIGMPTDRDTHYDEQINELFKMHISEDRPMTIGALLDCIGMLSYYYHFEDLRSMLPIFHDKITGAECDLYISEIFADGKNEQGRYFPELYLTMKKRSYDSETFDSHDELIENAVETLNEWYPGMKIYEIKFDSTGKTDSIAK